VGAAIYPRDGDSYESLMATADARMYRDKACRKEASAVAVAKPRPAERTEMVVHRAGFGVG
jgi:hypothetical protein